MDESGLFVAPLGTRYTDSVLRLAREFDTYG
mgnify:CR=1 FL=1